MVLRYDQVILLLHKQYTVSLKQCWHIVSDTPPLCVNSTFPERCLGRGGGGTPTVGGEGSKRHLACACCAASSSSPRRTAPTASVRRGCCCGRAGQAWLTLLIHRLRSFGILVEAKNAKAPQGCVLCVVCDACAVCAHTAFICLFFFCAGHLVCLFSTSFFCRCASNPATDPELTPRACNWSYTEISLDDYPEKRFVPWQSFNL